MKNAYRLLGIIFGTAAAAMASGPAAAPEIDPATCVSAFVLLAGAVLVIRGRRR